MPVHLVPKATIRLETPRQAFSAEPCLVPASSLGKMLAGSGTVSLSLITQLFPKGLCHLGSKSQCLCPRRVAKNNTLYDSNHQPPCGQGQLNKHRPKTRDQDIYYERVSNSALGLRRSVAYLVCPNGPCHVSLDRPPMLGLRLEGVACLIAPGRAYRYDRATSSVCRLTKQALEDVMFSHTYSR